MFRFTIRDVLWLMVVVALGVGWGLNHSAHVAREATHKEQVRRLTSERDALKESCLANEHILKDLTAKGILPP